MNSINNDANKSNQNFCREIRRCSLLLKVLFEENIENMNLVVNNQINNNINNNQ